jgi:excisionase family DNA binding protein
MVMIPTETARPAPAPLATADEVAAFLGVHRNYVYDIAARGEIPSVKFNGNRRFRWTEVEDWLAQQAMRPVGR